MENYLSADGCAVVSQFERPPDNILRIAFWLHFFDPRKHLNTSYGPVAVSDPKELPERLARIIQYEPVT